MASPVSHNQRVQQKVIGCGIRNCSRALPRTFVEVLLPYLSRALAWRVSFAVSIPSAQDWSTLWLWLTVRYGFSMAHRNRWFMLIIADLPIQNGDFPVRYVFNNVFFFWTSRRYFTSIKDPIPTYPCLTWKTPTMCLSENRVITGKNLWLIIISLIPSGKLTVCYGKSPFLMGKSTISTGPFSIANC